MAETDPFDNVNFTEWEAEFKAYLAARKRAEAGVGVNPGTMYSAYTASVTAKTVPSAAAIHPVDTALAEQEWDPYAELASGAYGAPKTDVLEQLILDERQKSTRASQANIMKWTAQLNILEGFRKFLAVKRMDKSVYVRATQAAATNADRVTNYMRLILDGQEPEVGGTRPK
jgi:hypothetical protein